MTARHPEAIPPESPQALLDQLKHKLVGFAVVDLQNQLIGEVQDVILNDQHQPTIVVIPANSAHAAPILLSGKQVQKVNSATRTLVVELAQSDSFRSSQVSADYADQHRGASAATDVLEEEPIRLLEERLIVDRSRRKVGEVIVRKEVETRLVQVPIRREKLIVEQISPEHRQLATVDLGEGEITGVELAAAAAGFTVQAEFNSLRQASQVLQALANQPDHGCQRIRIELVVTNAEQQATYQNWLQHYSNNGMVGQ